MQYHRRCIVVVVCFGALGVAVVACGTNPPPPAGGSTAASVAGSSTSGGPSANPNAAEVNAAGDIPDNQVFVAYTPPDGGWTVKVPEGWARTDVAGGASFTDKFNTVEVPAESAASAPSVDSVRAEQVPAITSAGGNVSDVKVSSVSRSAGDAVLVTWNADSAPNAVTGKTVRLAFERYEFWRNGTRVDVTVSGPVGADNVDPWKTVTDSFGWAR